VRTDPIRSLAAGAAGVTIALTAGAFWLSYEHLHDVAAANGLQDARAWAWPGTVDLFIVAGELLILRAALRGRLDWFAYLLTAAGSLGSIALNVAGVGWGASPLEYVVAAVPPVAALLAFAALMRQVHEALAKRVETPLPVPEMPTAAPKVPAVRLPVPDPVPEGVTFLPLVARPKPKAAIAAAKPSTPRVHAEYVPEVEDIPDPDPLLPKARADFAKMLFDGRTPGIRTLRDTYSIGQARAQRIRDNFLPVTA
jgi:hypothetical protein